MYLQGINVEVCPPSLTYDQVTRSRQRAHHSLVLEYLMSCRMCVYPEQTFLSSSRSSPASPGHYWPGSCSIMTLTNLGQTNLIS